MVPTNFAPHSTVYRWFLRLRDERVFETINYHLLIRDRERKTPPAFSCTPKHSFACSSTLLHVVRPGWDPRGSDADAHAPANRTCGQSQHYQTKMGSPRDRFGATVGIELGEDRRDMELGGVERDS